MGPSGSGKSTLLRGLIGRAPYSSGQIWVNGVECHATGGLGKFSHRVGLVPQADVLVDELSMVENIEYFHTITVDSGLEAHEVRKRAAQELTDIGLKDDPQKPFTERLTQKRIGDGSGRKSHISGGQAKRASIAMELVNDPDVLVIDEPTSGLSARDSLDLVKKLKEIAGRGKIVIVIIHQPGSEVFKLFDRLLLLDAGGHAVISGPRNEVERWLDKQTDASLQCGSCGSAFPERMMEVIERRPKPYWAEESRSFAAEFQPAAPPEIAPLPKRSRIRPLQAWGDLWALFSRHTLIKRRDKQSMALTFLVPPALGWLFATVFSASAPQQAYAFDRNALFPQLVFMLIVCALFLGMVSSAVEVIRDRPMLEREASRGLRMWAYLGTKFLSLMMFGCVQAFLLAVSAAAVIGATHLLAAMVGTLVLVMAVGVSLGLLISVVSSTSTKAFNLIPLVLLPQIVLGGALLPYRDMGQNLYLWETRREEHRPLVAALMPASWAHQLMMRTLYDASADRSEPMNIALADLRHIDRGGYLSLRPSTLLKANPAPTWIDEMPAGWVEWRAKPQALDTMVLLGIVLGSLGLGWSLIGRPYHLGGGARFIQTTGVLWAVAGLPTLLWSATVSNPVTSPPVEPGIDYVRSPAPMNFSKASQHCAALKARIPTLEEFVGIYREDRRNLPAGTFWLITSTNTPEKPQSVDTSRLTGAKRDELNVGLFKTTKGAFQPKASPLSSQRFVCVPLPRLKTNAD